MRRLLTAAQNGDVELIGRALEEGSIRPDDVRDEERCTLLHFGAANGHEQVARRLLEHSADPNARSQYGWTALMQASANGHIPVVRLLLKAKCSVDSVRAPPPHRRPVPADPRPPCREAASVHRPCSVRRRRGTRPLFIRCSLRE